MLFQCLQEPAGTLDWVLIYHTNKQTGQIITEIRNAFHLSHFSFRSVLSCLFILILPQPSFISIHFFLRFFSISLSITILFSSHLSSHSIPHFSLNFHFVFIGFDLHNTFTTTNISLFLFSTFLSVKTNKTILLRRPAQFSRNSLLLLLVLHLFHIHQHSLT